MKKSERTKQYIIERTAPIFNKKGYAGTSMSDLTEVTGLTKGAIYGNFENKDEVALAAFDFNYNRVVQAIAKEIEQQKSPFKKLKVFSSFYRTAYREHVLDIGCPIANTAPEVDDTHPALREKVNEAIALWDRTVQKLVQKGIEAGEIKADTNPSVVASLMISLIEGGILVTKSTGNTKYLYQSLDQVDKILDDIRA